MTVIAMSRFSPDVEVGRQVRGFVAGHLDQLCMQERADDVQLVVSELVANVVLHARTDFSVRLLSRPDGVRIEVADGSPVLPTPGTLGTAALSGRGLMLLQSIVSSWGADAVPGLGKVVWCELGREPVDEGLPPDVDALLAMWDDEPAPDAVSLPVEVTVPDLTVQGVLAAKLHMEDLLREVQMILIQHPDPSSTPPVLQPYTRLGRRLDAAAARFAEGRRQIRQQALAAAARGLDRVTLHLRLPQGAATAAEEYLAAIEEVERLGRSSAHLLPAQATMDVHAGLRHAYLRAIVVQLAGACPNGSHS